MLSIQSSRELAEAARTLASTCQLVCYKQQLYIPVNLLTDQPAANASPAETYWERLGLLDMQRLANAHVGVLFANNAELTNFELMLKQLAQPITWDVPEILVRTHTGLKRLDASGALAEPSGSFIPYCLPITINDDPELKEKVWNVLVEWVDSDATAHTMLHHFATALAPGWSAVKYVLLLGAGRNGKSVFLQMLSRIFGSHNTSSVSRQSISALSPVVTELNGSLINILMDGSAEYIKDSGPEKTLIAGERLSVRRLYESVQTEVQTNALFVEALNQEPKSRDKSSALQARLVRFRFPNKYELNPEFLEWALQDDTCGALLALLIDHYVTKAEVKEKLTIPETSEVLSLDQIILNNTVLQYVQYLAMLDSTINFIGDDLYAHIASYRAWVESQSRESFGTDAEIAREFRLFFTVKRSTKREGKRTINWYKITDISKEVSLILKEHQ